MFEYRKRKLEGKEYLMERIVMVPFSGCWIWIGPCDKDGYGIIKSKHGYRRAHRFSYSLFNGVIPDGLMVCHHCDIPECVNPTHLFAGTAKDNTQDMLKKGRRVIVKVTSCFMGHELTQENMTTGGKCRTCNMRRSTKRYAATRKEVRSNIGKSGVQGVFLRKNMTYTVQIFIDGKYKHLGVVDNIFEAVAIRQSAENEKKRNKL